MVFVSAGCPKGKGKLMSKKGKPLTKCVSRETAMKRERQIQFFKHQKR